MIGHYKSINVWQYDRKVIAAIHCILPIISVNYLVTDTNSIPWRVRAD